VNVANRAGEASSWCYWRRTALGRFVGNPDTGQKTGFWEAEPASSGWSALQKARGEHGVEKFHTGSNRMTPWLGFRFEVLQMFQTGVTEQE
jgi:hypothetical protein